MSNVSAQISLYPLRQEHLSPAIEETLKVLQDHGCEVRPGTMSTLVTGDDEPVFSALREAFRRAAEYGDVTMVVTISNACPRSIEKKVEH
jgi:uncharacterized protein YqgV (UPF0045/DUF77 family)